MTNVLDPGRALLVAGVIAIVAVGCGSPGSPAAGAGAAGGGTGSGAGAASSGGSAGAGGAADTSDMCTLLTSSEVQAAAGLPVASSGPGDMDAAHYCEWQLEPGTNGEGVSFKRTVAITRFAGASSFEVMAQGASPVPDVGDRAVTIDHNVMVLKGDIHFGVVVILHEPGDDDAGLASKEEQVSKDLATKAAARL